VDILPEEGILLEENILAAEDTLAAAHYQEGGEHLVAVVYHPTNMEPAFLRCLPQKMNPQNFWFSRTNLFRIDTHIL